MTPHQVFERQFGAAVAPQVLVLEHRMPIAVLALRDEEGAPPRSIAPMPGHERASRAPAVLSIRGFQSVASVGSCEVRAGCEPARATSITHQKWSEGQTPPALAHRAVPNLTAWTLAIAAAIAAPGTVAALVICLNAGGWL